MLRPVLIGVARAMTAADPVEHNRRLVHRIVEDNLTRSRRLGLLD